MNQNVKIELFDCGLDWNDSRYDDIKNKILSEAQEFVNDNAITLKKIFADILNDKDEKKQFYENEPVFFITGQSISSMLLSDILPHYPKIFNDLDIFIPDFINDTSNNTEESDEFIETRYMVQSDSRNAVKDVKDFKNEHTFIKSSFKLHLKIQTIKYQNVYCSSAAKSMPFRYQRMAFSVIDGFDIDYVKIGLLFNKNLKKIYLLIHPEVLKKIADEDVLFRCKHHNPSTYIRCYEKNLNMLTTVGHFDKDKRDFLINEIFKYMKSEFQNLKTAGVYSLTFIKNNAGPIYGDDLNIRHLPYINISAQPKVIHRLRDVCIRLEGLVGSYEEGRLLKRQFDEFQKSFRLQSDILYLEPQKINISLYFEKIAKKFNMRLSTQDIAELIGNENNIKNKSAYLSFIKAIKKIKVHSDSRLIVLISRWFDELVEEFSLEKLVEAYEFLQKSSQITSQITKHFYIKKAFFDFMKHYDRDNLSKLIKKYYLSYIDKENVSDKTISIFLSKTQRFLSQIVYRDLAIIFDTYDLSELIAKEIKSTSMIKLLDDVYYIKDKTTINEIFNVLSHEYGLSDNVFKTINKKLFSETEVFGVWDDASFKVDFLLYEKEVKCMFIVYSTYSQPRKKNYYIIDLNKNEMYEDLDKLHQYPNLNYVFKKLLLLEHRG